ncbi:MAG: hypothetical protein GXP54_06960, partial [Deltaproteobacteria bacterium]|nr:hypothetical protein [Deltaproteobacteria bacterium]
TLVLAAGCGGNGGTDSVKTPFKPVTNTTSLDYEIKTLSGSSKPVTIQWVGKQTFNNATWDQFQTTYPVSEGIKTVDIFGRLEGSEGVTIAGYRSTYPAAAAGKDHTLTLDQPVSVDTTKIPVGVQQETVAGGTLELGDGTPPITGRVKARYTKTTADATVESRFGTVSGVQIYEGDVTLEDAAGSDLVDAFKGQTATGRIWFHPTLGVLKVEVDDWPIGAAMTGEHDCGDPNASDYNTIQKVGLLSPEAPEFVLSSHDCSGEYDADKERHAQMLLELRWADEAKALTPDQPMVNVEFSTMWGTFPFSLLSSPVSIFHPEENGQGFTYWYAFVNEAAKNEPGDNGIMYQVKVNFPDYMTSHVRATARVRYPIYRP